MPPPRKPLSRTPSCHDLGFTLRSVFKKKDFRYVYTLLVVGSVADLCRPIQREVITATLNGKDVFLQAATSFGKSLCYQLPAVIDHGSKYIRFRYILVLIDQLVTIVISPLLSLMVSKPEL